MIPKRGTKAWKRFKKFKQGDIILDALGAPWYVWFGITAMPADSREAEYEYVEELTYPVTIIARNGAPKNKLVK